MSRRIVPNSALQRNRRRRGCRGYLCEGLENRTLLSALSVAGPGSGHDSFTLDVTPAGGVKLVVDGAEHDYAPGQFDSVAIFLDAISDTIDVRATVVPVSISQAQITVVNVGDANGVQDIRAPLVVAAAQNSTQMNLDDTGDPTAREIVLNSSDRISGLAPADITCVPSDPRGQTIAFKIITGSGSDNVNVQGLAAGLLTLDNSGGHDTISLGADRNTQILDSAGDSSLIIGVGSGALTVNAAGGTLTAGSNTIQFPANVSSVTLNGPGLRFDQQVATPTVYTINTGNVDSAIEIDGLQTMLNVDLGSGHNTVTLNGPIIGSANFNGDPSSAAGSVLVVNTQLGGGDGPAGIVPGAVFYGTGSIIYPEFQSLDVATGNYIAYTDLGNINLQTQFLPVGSSGSPPAITFNAPQNLNSLSVENGTVSVAGGAVNVNALNVSSAGRIDLLTNSLKVNYSAGQDPAATIRAWLAGGQIFSSKSDARHTVGYGDSADGVVDELKNGVLIKYALEGDANLDGTVNMRDLLILAQHYNKPNAFWDQGDFNYDGTVNFQDCMLLARNYGSCDLPMATASATAAATTVPRTLVVSGNPQLADNTITLGVTPAGGVEAVINGVTQDYAPGQWDDVSVQASAFVDNVNVKATIVPAAMNASTGTLNVTLNDARGVQDIRAKVTIVGAISRTGINLTINDAGNSTPRPVTITDDASAQVQRFLGIAPAEIDYDYANTVIKSANIVVATGSGPDVVDVQGTSQSMASLTVNNNGGTDFVRVGDGLLAPIQSPVTLGGSGPDALVIDDSADLQPVQFRADYLLDVQIGGSGSTPLTIRPGFNLASTTIDGGRGNNTFSVGAFGNADTSAPLILNPGPGDNFVELIPGAGATPSQLTRTPQTLVNLGAGHNQVRIDGTLLGSVLLNGSASTPAANALTLALSPVSQSSGGLGLARGVVFAATGSIVYTGFHSVDFQGGTYIAYGDLGRIDVTVDPLSEDSSQYGTPSITFNTTQNLNSLTVNAGKVALSAGGNESLNLKSLQIQSTGKLDLNDSRMTIRYGSNPDPAAALRGWLAAGALFSSLADSKHALGYGDSADGIVPSLTGGEILVKYTLGGDANLDGAVNKQDLQILANDYGQTNANWDQGDFNYDGTVNMADLMILVNNFAQ